MAIQKERAISLSGNIRRFKGIQMTKPKCKKCGSSLIPSELKEFNEKRKENRFNGIYEEPKIMCSTCKKKKE